MKEQEELFAKAKAFREKRWKEVKAEEEARVAAALLAYEKSKKTMSIEDAAYTALRDINLAKGTKV